jgi:hypothetical protein
MIHSMKGLVTIQRATRCLLGLFALGTSVVPAIGWTHGGVSVEDDVCIIQIGRYKAHFTGYLPAERATQEFCEDIPMVGQSVFVIDFISDELREMDLDFRIIRDVNGVGTKATYEDLGGEKAIEAATIFYLPPGRYPRGVLNANYQFAEKGGYVGIINAKHRETGLAYRSVFPFRVGRFSYSRYVFYFAALIIGCGLFVWASGRSTFFKPAARAGTP